MTYCVALRLEAGLVMLADTRTNAGVDNVSRFRKFYSWEAPGERVLCLLAAGNLSLTQGVVTRLNQDIRRAGAGEDVETVLNAASMVRVAEIVGERMHELQGRYRDALIEHGAEAHATVLVAGQRAGGIHRLFMVYSAGNFIEATEDTPFFQIGEHKYGKPILDRVIRPATPLEAGVKAVLLSMDSTLRSNLSVGMPLDLAVIRAGELGFALKRRIEPDDPGFERLSRGWAEGLRQAFDALPGLDAG